MISLAGPKSRDNTVVSLSDRSGHRAIPFDSVASGLSDTRRSITIAGIMACGSEWNTTKSTRNALACFTGVSGQDFCRRTEVTWPDPPDMEVGHATVCLRLEDLLDDVDAAM
jgi:hypothetical protein